MIHLSGLKTRDEKHPNGDISIEYTGLRPGEKLFEELLVGDTVSGTQHPRIMRAEEHSLSWDETKIILDELDIACHNYRCDLVQELLTKAPTGYTCKKIEDLVWGHTRRDTAPLGVSTRSCCRKPRPITWRRASPVHPPPRPESRTAGPRGNEGGNERP